MEANRAPNGRRVLERARHARDEAADLAAAVEDVLNESRAYLTGLLERRPYATLAAGFGVGYVLGGGIPPRAMRLLMDIGTKVAISMLVRELAAGLRDSESSDVASEQMH